MDEKFSYRKMARYSNSSHSAFEAPTLLESICKKFGMGPVFVIDSENFADHETSDKKFIGTATQYFSSLGTTGPKES
jgi:hypothetical protein